MGNRLNIKELLEGLKEKHFTCEEAFTVIQKLTEQKELTIEQFEMGSYMLGFSVSGEKLPHYNEMKKAFEDEKLTREDLVKKEDKEYTVEDLRYNEEVKTFGERYHELNYFVMTHTKETYETNKEIKNDLELSISGEKVIEDGLKLFLPEDGETQDIIVTQRRALEAAKEYKNKKVAVLNFGNNHTPGGSPYTAGTQQESICRCSTLLPCLEAMYDIYYAKHIRAYERKEMNLFGNDDIIYTSDVLVFKSDESAPKMLPKDERYHVDVITAAAPQIIGKVDYYSLEKVLYSRISKIIQVAKSNEVEVLILGAFGCGGLNNPPLLVASIFKRVLKKYKFDKVEFAVFGRDQHNQNYEVFKDILG